MLPPNTLYLYHWIKGRIMIAPESPLVHGRGDSKLHYLRKSERNDFLVQCGHGMPSYRTHSKCPVVESRLWNHPVPIVLILTLLKINFAWN